MRVAEDFGEAMDERIDVVGDLAENVGVDVVVEVADEAAR